jgi:hypothetical protein
MTTQRAKGMEFAKAILVGVSDVSALYVTHHDDLVEAGAVSTLAAQRQP